MGVSPVPQEGKDRAKKNLPRSTGDTRAGTLGPRPGPRQQLLTMLTPGQKLTLGATSSGGPTQGAKHGHVQGDVRIRLH